jgi:UDP-N-acetylmuramoyl-L-alanyl-D-glutamate--2,6-diaminopimelate ligase
MMAAGMTVAAMTLGELLGGAAGRYAETTITDLALDSRDVTPGAAFIALAGSHVHGLKFAPESFERGAAIVLYEAGHARFDSDRPHVAVPNLKERLGQLARKFYRTQDAGTKIVGITGTNGKTTVAWLIANALAALDRKAGYIGTLGFGAPDTLTRHRLTTPDTLTLHREIASLGVDYVALEVSSHALAQNRTAGLDISVAVFTNLSRDHLDAHGDLKTYAATKARLFAHAGLTQAILNLDDEHVAQMRERIAESVDVIGVSKDPELRADITFSTIRSTISGTEVAIDCAGVASRMRSRLIGDFNAENLVLALAALTSLGVSLNDASRMLSTAPPPPGRMEVVGTTRNGATVIVDYAHTPAALQRALGALRPLTGGELWCVFGCGGDRDRGKRLDMGRAAARGADRSVLTSDNPRSEDPLSIIAGVRAGFGNGEPIVEADRRAAITLAIDAAGPADTVLIAGRGHETEQDVGTSLVPLDDREVVRTALGGSS